ncbi:MAG TPA: orotidine-5'-phosphate decarboxylase [Ignavibacteriaceae bacterium]|nr:orotidine-5'-phosphate decarboxylase [Ignavibacteriaceae bacterium]
MTALEKLKLKNERNKFICVGLDTDINKIPEHLKNFSNPILEFNKSIIEATTDYAAAYKINFAFYEKDGEKGFDNILKTIELIPNDVLIIADAKRGDIGNTSQMYADAIYDYFKCDSLTLHPYMGRDSVIPFLARNDKLNFILALTSNPGSADFEKLELEDGTFLFQKVISKVKEWNVNENCGIVFGATKSSDLNNNMGLISNLPVLLPGVGAQGGSLEDVVSVFKSKSRKNYIINSSRGIIYKGSGKDFAFVARTEIIALNERVKEILNK